MNCKHCGSMMKRTLRFENGKAYRLFKCPNCYKETKPIPVSFNSLETSKNNTHTKPKKKGKIK